MLLQRSMSLSSFEEQSTEKLLDSNEAPKEVFDGRFHLYEHDLSEKLKSLERDKELLSSSLFALTTHFAQVQFRLRQVIHAPPEAKEQLLESLEEFAYRGIPDLGILKKEVDEASLVNGVRLKRQQQKKLFGNLKMQLNQLEEYAFKRKGEVAYELESKIKIEIQKEKVNMLTPNNISREICVVVNELKMKERLVNQLKVQIVDLERFVQFLQRIVREKTSSTKYAQQKPVSTVIHRFVKALEIFTTLQFGCTFMNFGTKNRNDNMKEYIPLKAKVVKAVAKVREIVERKQKEDTDSCGNDRLNYQIALTKFVRKSLAPSIRNLIQHGTCTSINSNLVPFTNCLSRTYHGNTHIHAWEILLKYYKMQSAKSNKSRFNTNLLMSFNLNPLDISQSSPTEELLWSIKNIISMHERYKKEADSQFKAFVCSALNSRKLVPWLTLVFTNQQIVNEFYQPWSYVARTKFQDIFDCLDTLTRYRFDLPVNIAVQHFQNIKDIFY